jgi:hypothetical protein
MQIEIMVSKQDARSLAILAMSDALMTDLETRFNRGSMPHAEIKDIQAKIKAVDRHIKGRVRDEYVLASERFFARVQLALDEFWGVITDQDRKDADTAWTGEKDDHRRLRVEPGPTVKRGAKGRFEKL